VLYTERSERKVRTKRRLAICNDHASFCVPRQVPLMNWRYLKATTVYLSFRHFNLILTLVFIFVSVVMLSSAFEYTLIVMAVSHNLVLPIPLMHWHIYYFSKKAYKARTRYMIVNRVLAMEITHKTCHVCDVTIHRASMAKHIRSNKHLIRLGVLPNEIRCYIKLKKKTYNNPSCASSDSLSEV